jgi:hypothetical protein
VLRGAEGARAPEHPKPEIHRVDPKFGSTLIVSNRDSHSNCGVNLRILGQPFEFYLRPPPPPQRSHTTHQVMHGAHERKSLPWSAACRPSYCPFTTEAPIGGLRNRIEARDLAAQPEHS